MGESIALNLQRSLTIDEIYKKAKDYDIVLTVDAPLADALNARLSTPKLGPFATTPRRLALRRVHGEEKFHEKRQLFLQILNKTDMNWKQASYLFENIINCWMETGDITSIIDNER